MRPRWAVVSLAAGNRYRFPHEEALARWRGQAADRLAPEPAARVGRRRRRADAEFLDEIADDEIAPFVVEAQAEQLHREARGIASHFVSSRPSSPSAIDWKA